MPIGRTDHTGRDQGYASSNAFKVGSDSTPNGWVYIYHNTISLIHPSGQGTEMQDSGGAYFSNAVTRNNIWHVSGHVFNLRSATATQNHNLDCDNLHNLNPTDNSFIEWSGSLYRNLAEFQRHTQQEIHGIPNTRTLFNSKMELEPGSPDIDADVSLRALTIMGPMLT